jgi:hypothetical protein
VQGILVFIGGCTLGLYARPDGAPLRATKDVDCISTLVPWVLQEKILGDMCSRGVLSPDADLQCRYRIRGTELDVDVLSPAGFNVGGVNPWFERAAQRARAYDVGEGRWVMALTPPYFLTTVEGVRADVAALWGRALAKYSLRESDLPDLVDWHLDSREAIHREAVIAALVVLVGGRL